MNYCWKAKLVMKERGKPFGFEGQSQFDDSILSPLSKDSGVVFPYTPTIMMAHSANYGTYDVAGSIYQQNYYMNTPNPSISITAQFSSKGHNVFACIRGHLIEETRQDVLDAHWSRQAESWFEKGKDDPELIMLRFELDDAEIWHVSPDLSGLLKLAVGKNVEPEEMGERETVRFR